LLKIDFRTSFRIDMLGSMLKTAFHLRTGAEALAVFCNVEALVVVRLALVVLISILITPLHAEPV